LIRAFAGTTLRPLPACITPTLTRMRLRCAGDAVQGKGGLRGGEQGVTPVFRFTARVCGHAGKAHVELGGGHKVIAAADHRTGRDAGTNMDGSK
jgi:hypothetical protein